MLKTTNFKEIGEKYTGKVRDCYIGRDRRVLISTDRISAFDRILGFIPDKGQVLTRLSEFWFTKTSKIIDNHMISVPHANVMVVKNATPIPLEIVVRGYITGVTNTSIWGSYERGERTIYGIKFPAGLVKNDKLPKPVITPTTKAAEGHDERITKKEILESKLLTPKLWKQIEEVALGLFEAGTRICNKAGIILVDTKYEFGLYDGKLILIDEIHTPDSSRFWIKKTYKERLARALEPENFDKEFLRLWYAQRGYKGDGEPPKMTKDFADQVSKRYISIYQKITGKKFSQDKKDLTVNLIHDALKTPIIGITGPFGSGKTTASKMLQDEGYASFTFSDVIKKKAKKMGLRTDVRSILQDIGDSMRKKQGNDILAKLTFSSVRSSNLKFVIIDGIRNRGELEYIKNRGGFIIGIDADSDVRFTRVSKNGGFYYGKSREEFDLDEKRDWGENEKSYGQHAQECLDAADMIIENNGSIKELKQKLLNAILS